MTKVFHIKSETNVFSTNNPAKIIEVKDNTVVSDSEWREVIKRGYLLSQINLSSVPSIIADAIRAAMEDAKNNMLSDALIQNLRLSIEQLDDGIYKKTYIDNNITYLEDLLISKVDAETVAAIGRAQIATAVQGFAAAADVGIVLSRVENSESEIISIKETMNTKDVARATQIETLSARIDDTFAGYSNAIELYVDTDGNVKSQKIETLSTNIGLQIQETNQLIVDSNNEWKAKSMKLITNPNGGITGYSFEDGSGLKSNFTINADNFKISNSTNTYTPFSIVDNNITFNGKVSFSNTTTSTGATLIDVLDELQNDLTATLSENNTTALLEIANVDGKIDTKEQELINSINAEASTRATQITARINAEALLDGKIDAEETARINAATALETALKNYTDVVADALIDGEISAAEQNAINEAQIRVNTAKTQLVTMINNLTKVEDISWQSEVQNAINNNVTTIDGGKIVTNTLLGNTIKTNTLSANTLVAGTGSSTVWKGGGLVSSNFNGNAHGNIGSPTAGFRLSSDAAGTSANPNIYGAYIKGASIEGGTITGVTFNVSDLRVRSTMDPSKTGLISRSISSGSFYGRNYGSGHISERVCSTTSQIVVSASITSSGLPNTSSNCYLEYSVGSGWIQIASASHLLEVSNAGKLIMSFNLFAIVEGASVPAEGGITFRIRGVGQYVTFSGAKWIATLNNQ